MQWQLGNLIGQIRVTELPGPSAPGPLLESLCAQVDPVLLESTALHTEFGRYSILACRPLAIMEMQLENSEYLVADRYTIADISLYAYTHVAHEGGFDLSGYSAISSWIKRIASEPKHVTMEQFSG